MRIYFLLFFIIALFIWVYFDVNPIYGKGETSIGDQNIVISDPNLKTELVVSGLDFPTTMAFLGNDDFIILEKNTGNVKRVVNGNVLENPLLHVDTSGKDERGLLGIAVKEKENFENAFNAEEGITHNVFLYYVSCESKNINCENRVYKYDLDNKNNVLINSKLLLSIPSFPDPSHVGGIIDIGPDNNLYLTVGNFQRTIPSEVYQTPVQNVENSEPPDGRAGILRITQDGNPVGKGILGDEYPLNLYYAYGVKNSFGIDFDPVTGHLWDTENGPDFGDEINLVEPGFNSGSDKIYGIWRSDDKGDKIKIDGKKNEPITVGKNPKDLVYFGGKGHYSEPELTWGKTVAPTAISFLNSKNLGNEYENDIFVGSADGGRIFHFDLTESRTGLLLDGILEDKIALDNTEFDDILFAEGFNLITDLKLGPDGYIYVVSGLKNSKTENSGAVFRIIPTENNIKKQFLEEQGEEKITAFSILTNKKSNLEDNSKRELKLLSDTVEEKSDTTKRNVTALNDIIQNVSEREIINEHLTKNKKKFTIIAAGDFGCSIRAQENIKNIQLQEPELFLVLGDISYTPTPDCWFNMTRDLDSKIKIAVGNHEDKEEPDGSDDLIQTYLEHYKLPNSYYSFDYENVHVLVLNTQLEISTDTLEATAIPNDDDYDDYLKYTKNYEKPIEQNSDKKKNNNNSNGKHKALQTNYPIIELADLLNKYSISMNVPKVDALLDKEAIVKDVKVDPKQYVFAIEDLKKAANDKSIDWIFVMFHKPIYSSPSKQLEEYIIREKYQPLFDQYNVDLVLQGHNHIYDRTLPIKFNPLNITKPITDKITERNSFVNPDGTLYTVVGTGGKGPSRISDTPFYIAQQYLAVAGFLNIDIDGKELKATFYDIGLKCKDTKSKKTDKTILDLESCQPQEKLNQLEAIDTYKILKK